MQYAYGIAHSASQFDSSVVTLWVPTEFLVLIHWYFILYIVVLYVYWKVMYRIQHSDRYPPLLRVSPRGLRALPQLGKCNFDPETW